jgi:hypothetical protein
MTSFSKIGVVAVALIACGMARAENVPTIADYHGISDPRYVCLKNLWISPSGSDANTGLTPDAPRLSIAGTVALATPGTCVRALPGTYTSDGRNNVIRKGGNADTPAGYVVLLSDTPHAAHIVPSTTTYSFNTLDLQNLSTSASYIIIDGLDIQGELAWSGKGGSAIEIKNGHHYKIINNILHDSSACGLQTHSIDYLLLQGNVIYGNAKFGISHYSGVSLLGPAAFDTLPGFHYVVRNNIVYGNTEGPVITTNHTDGNGIILDSWGNLHGYAQQVVIENNLIFHNGHRGLEVLNATGGGILFRNNTIYKNGQDPARYGTEGEIVIWNSPRTVAANNIMVADPVANPNNTAMLIVNDGNSSVLANNMSFNGIIGQSSYATVTSTAPFAGVNGNQAGVDPLLSMPSSDLAGSDFHLSAQSPALGAGTLAYGFAAADAAGAPRVVDGLIDIGAYQGTVRNR